MHWIEILIAKKTNIAIINILKYNLLKLFKNLNKTN